MTRKEFIIRHIAFEEGMIQVYQDTMDHCRFCIEAHRKELKKERIEEVADRNSHLWETY